MDEPAQREGRAWLQSGHEFGGGEEYYSTCNILSSAFLSDTYQHFPGPGERRGLVGVGGSFFCSCSLAVLICGLLWDLEKGNKPENSTVLLLLVIMPPSSAYNYFL